MAPLKTCMRRLIESTVPKGRCFFFAGKKAGTTLSGWCCKLLINVLSGNIAVAALRPDVCDRLRLQQRMWLGDGCLHVAVSPLFLMVGSE